MTLQDIAPVECAYWPNPTELPLYVTVDEAAKISGIAQDTIRAWANSALDPLPHVIAGKRKVLIRTAALPEYIKRKERY